MKIFIYHENGWRMIQAERLPVKPDSKNYLYPGPLVSDVRAYESEIAELKAKAIPVGNPEILKEYLGWIGIDGMLFWPGDVEIKDIKQDSKEMEFAFVAILTLPKTTRQEKVAQFFKQTGYRARWCNPGPGGCACMGCVNLSPKKKEWYAMFPNDPYLTKEDVDDYRLTLPKEPQP